MKTKILFAFLFFISHFINGQTTFQKIYGGSGVDNANKIEKTSDGNFIICGSTTSFKSGGYDVLLQKVNPTGDIIWSKTYGLSSTTANAASEYATCVKQTSDGGYILTGRTNSFSNNSNNGEVFLLKADNLGGLQWIKVYRDTFCDVIGTSVFQTPEGGYVLAGNTNLNQAFVIKTNSVGDTLWTKKYYSDCESNLNMVATNDKGYLFSHVLYDFSQRAIKIDSLGNLQWVKRYKVNLSIYYFTQTIPTSDGGYLLVGYVDDYTSSGGGAAPNFYLLKINASGDTLWAKEYGMATNIDKIYSVFETSNHDYICAGSTAPFNNAQNNPDSLCLLKIDNMGNLIWTKAYSNNGGTVSVTPSSIFVEPSGNVYVLGVSNYGAGNNIFLLMTDTSGNHPCSANFPFPTSSPSFPIDTISFSINNFPIIPTSVTFNDTPSLFFTSGATCNMIGIDEYNQKTETFLIYPNPSSQNVTISNEQIINEIKIIDLLGQIIYQDKPNEQKINLQIEEKGIYFVTVICGKESTTKKLIIN